MSAFFCLDDPSPDALIVEKCVYLEIAFFSYLNQLGKVPPLSFIKCWLNVIILMRLLTFGQTLSKATFSFRPYKNPESLNPFKHSYSWWMKGSLHILHCNNSSHRLIAQRNISQKMHHNCHSSQMTKQFNKTFTTDPRSDGGEDRASSDALDSEFEPWYAYEFCFSIPYAKWLLEARRSPNLVNLSKGRG